jgi:hypothetical protein
MRSSSPRRWLTGSAVALACATAVLAPPVSAAAPSPELGRCMKLEGVKEGKKTVYHGSYVNSKCTKLSAVKNRKYEWAPGVGPHHGFTGVGGPSFVVEGDRSPAPVTRCGSESMEGEFTGATTLAEHAVFGGCEWAQYACVEAGNSEELECPQPCPELPEGAANERECEVFYPCRSEGAAAGEVRGPLPLIGELALISGGHKPKVAIALNGGGFGYQCDLREMSSLSNFDSGELAPLNKMTTELRLNFGPTSTRRASSQLRDIFTLEEPVEVRAIE